MRKNAQFFMLLAVFLCFFSTCSPSGNYSQPIAYNHKIHIEEAELGCIDCHARSTTHQKASIPNIELCVECHEEAMTESTEEEKLVAHITENQRIPWVQVHRVPDHAYFSHRRHVTLGKVGCTECHGNVAAMTRPFAKPSVKITMEWCLACHEKNRVDTDCATCHR